ncbi:MAG: thiamine phosphate synthase [Pyrinomonadaceae bacterium]
MKFKLPRIYPITDVRLAGISHKAQVELLAAVGAELIQIREKNASPKEFFDDAAEALQAARARGIKLIINDRIDIALALKAHGVHLGQDDVPPIVARRILGDDAIIGYSTHSAEQALEALRLPIDYIAIGPIFTTATKKDPDRTIGIAGLQQVRANIGDFPLVGIGGIDSANIRSVFEGGADSAAIISGLISDPDDIGDRFRALNDL